MGGLFKKPDTSAADRQIAEQRAETARMKEQADAERRELAEKEEARRRARLRGGSRSLLAEARVSPEEGVTTLGASGTDRMA